MGRYVHLYAVSFVSWKLKGFLEGTPTPPPSESAPRSRTNGISEPCAVVIDSEGFPDFQLRGKQDARINR